MRSGRLGFPFTAGHVWLPGRRSGGQAAPVCGNPRPALPSPPEHLSSPSCSGALPAFLAHWAKSGDTGGQFPSPFVGV